MTDHLKTIRHAINRALTSVEGAADDELKQSLTALDALEQAMREPVGYVHPQALDRIRKGETAAFRKKPYEGESTHAVYLAPPAQQARECGVCGSDKAFSGTCGGGRNNPKALCYETPAQQAQPTKELKCVCGADWEWLDEYGDWELVSTPGNQAQPPMIPATAYDRLQALCDSQAQRLLEIEEQPAQAEAALDRMAENERELGIQMQAEAVPQEGWKLVPVEPTIEMIYAAQVEGHGGDNSEVIADYKAMLAAAPQPKEPT